MIGTSSVLRMLKSAVPGVAKSLAAKGARHILVGKTPAIARIDKALEDDKENVFWLLQQVAISVTRNVFMHETQSGEDAWNYLAAKSGDAAFARRLRALWNEASLSTTDERIAMLATGFFVGGQPASLRERLDWALRGLFPDDVGVLRTVIQHHHLLAHGEQLMGLELTQSDTACVLVRAPDGVPRGVDGQRVEMQSLRALNGAHCLAVSDGGGDQGSVIVHQSMPAGVERAHVLDVLPLGRELLRVLDRIDWREIARSRGATAVAGPKPR